MNRNVLRGHIYSSLALAFASFGDAFLYPFLPMNFASVGIPIAWVGILLSINRFIRIVSNGFMTLLFDLYGLRIVMIFAVLIAILSTVGYGMVWGIVPWIILRICWGLSFSALRIGTLYYAIRHPKQGLSLGVSRGLQEAGPMIILFLTPLLLGETTTTIFLLLTIFSIPAIAFAFALPRDLASPIASKLGLTLKFPSCINSITLFSAIIIDGIVVVVLGKLFLDNRGDVGIALATSLSAFYLGLRRIFLVTLSPIGGWMADKFGLEKVFKVSIFLVVIGLSFVASGWIAIGITTTFLVYSINVAITPGIVIKNEKQSIGAIASNTTWRDIGAASGTLLGGFLLQSEHLITALILAILILMILVVKYLDIKKTSKLLFLWR